MLMFHSAYACLVAAWSGANVMGATVDGQAPRTFISAGSSLYNQTVLKVCTVVYVLYAYDLLIV